MESIKQKSEKKTIVSTSSLILVAVFPLLRDYVTFQVHSIWQVKMNFAQNWLGVVKYIHFCMFPNYSGLITFKVTAIGARAL